MVAPAAAPDRTAAVVGVDEVETDALERETITVEAAAVAV
jgi:hypothetical protein